MLEYMEVGSSLGLGTLQLDLSMVHLDLELFWLLVLQIDGCALHVEYADADGLVWLRLVCLVLFTCVLRCVGAPTLQYDWLDVGPQWHVHYLTLVVLQVPLLVHYVVLVLCLHQDVGSPPLWGHFHEAASVDVSGSLGWVVPIACITGGGKPSCSWV